MKLTLEERFLQHVSPEPNTGCWLFTGCCNRDGYGVMRVDGRNILAHRLAYALFRGEIPVGLTLDHGCRQRCCVNPQHLEAISGLENWRRGDGLFALTAGTAAKRAITHCPQGHPYSGANLYVFRNERLCRACRREREKARWTVTKARMQA